MQSPFSGKIGIVNNRHENIYAQQCPEPEAFGQQDVFFLIE